MPVVPARVSVPSGRKVVPGGLVVAPGGDAVGPHVDAGKGWGLDEVGVEIVGLGYGGVAIKDGDERSLGRHVAEKDPVGGFDLLRAAAGAKDNEAVGIDRGLVVAIEVAAVAGNNVTVVDYGLPGESLEEALVASAITNASESTVRRSTLLRSDMSNPRSV